MFLVNMLYNVNSELKASVVERFNRTFKEKMWRNFTYRGKYVYFDELANMTKAYNKSYHRTIQKKVKYTKTFSNSVEYNEDQIQGFFTNTCVLYVVLFILMINRGFSIRKLLSCFNLKNFDLNDFRISFID
jgi:hypothetical protein